jgi:hypothetical protein
LKQALTSLAAYQQGDDYCFQGKDMLLPEFSFKAQSHIPCKLENRQQCL